MAGKKILYISGSLGLGHIKRDLVIAEELRRLQPDLQISWIAAHPASQLVQEAGEQLHPGAASYANDNEPAEQAARGGQLNLLRYLIKASKHWKRNVEVYAQITSREHFDLVIGDETYELVVGLIKRPELKRSPFVMIYDFVGLDAMTPNPFEWLGIYLWNRIWSKDLRAGRAAVFDKGLFIGEEQDVPDRPFGPLLPGRRQWARRYCEFVGYVLPFDPQTLKDRDAVRARLGYSGPLIVCAIGGTAVGRELLELCGRAYPLLAPRLPGLRMLLVCGPRLATEGLDVPEGVEVCGYLPDLHEHFAACDLAIVQGGATTTLELTALGRPFIYFPLEGHFEQAQVAQRLQRHRAGVPLTLSRTGAQALSAKALDALGRPVASATVPVDGGRRAAQLINELL